MPVAVDGMMQAPLVPHTGRLNVSPVPNGVARSPTLSDARVSNSRHGVIETNDEVAESAACAYQPSPPPAPNDTATAAPIAAQRERINDIPIAQPLSAGSPDQLGGERQRCQQWIKLSMRTETWATRHSRKQAFEDEIDFPLEAPLAGISVQGRASISPGSSAAAW